MWHSRPAPPTRFLRRCPASTAHFPVPHLSVYGRPRDPRQLGSAARRGAHTEGGVTKRPGKLPASLQAPGGPAWPPVAVPAMDFQLRLRHPSGDIGPFAVSDSLTVAAVKDLVFAQWPCEGALAKEPPACAADLRLLCAGKFLDNARALKGAWCPRGAAASVRTRRLHAHTAAAARARACVHTAGTRSMPCARRAPRCRAAGCGCGSHAAASAACDCVSRSHPRMCHAPRRPVTRSLCLCPLPPPAQTTARRSATLRQAVSSPCTCWYGRRPRAKQVRAARLPACKLEPDTGTRPAPRPPPPLRLACIWC